MAGGVDVRTRQRVVIEFLSAEGTGPTDIHVRLKRVFGDCAVDSATVTRWVKTVVLCGSGGGGVLREEGKQQQHQEPSETFNGSPPSSSSSSSVVSRPTTLQPHPAPLHPQQQQPQRQQPQPLVTAPTRSDSGSDVIPPLIRNGECTTSSQSPSNGPDILEGTQNLLFAPSGSGHVISVTQQQQQQDHLIQNNGYTHKIETSTTPVLYIILYIFYLSSSTNACSSTTSL